MEETTLAKLTAAEVSLVAVLELASAASRRLAGEATGESTAKGNHVGAGADTAAACEALGAQLVRTLEAAHDDLSDAILAVAASKRAAASSDSGTSAHTLHAPP